MPQITCVRHGQANSAARDEGDYDQLSPLGWTQAGWLGEYFRSSGEKNARVYTGTLRRQKETAQAIDAGPDPVRDARLNEFEYFTMSQLLKEQHGITPPAAQEAFMEHLPKLFTMWKDGQIEGAPERFEDFETRVTEALHDISAGSENALIVTSGGVISMMVKHTLGLDIRGMARIGLAIQNTSLHRWMTFPSGLALTQFNATPHLDTIERRHAQTHV